MNATYHRRCRWLARHGVRIKRAGHQWIAKCDGVLVNYARLKRDVVRDTFREFKLGVGS